MKNTANLIPASFRGRLADSGEAASISKPLFFFFQNVGRKRWTSSRLGTMETLLTAAADPQVDPNLRDHDGTPLLLAAMDGWSVGHDEVAKDLARFGLSGEEGWDGSGDCGECELAGAMLLARGADPFASVSGALDDTPFLAAIRGRMFSLAAAMLRHPSCPSPEALSGAKLHGDGLLHQTSRCPPFFQLLIEKGMDTNARSKAGMTPLFTAVNAESVTALLKAGADPNLVDQSGLTAVEYWISHGVPQLPKMRTALIRGSKHLTLVNDNAIFEAAESGKIKNIDVAMRLNPKAMHSVRQVDGLEINPLDMAVAGLISRYQYGRPSRANTPAMLRILKSRSDWPHSSRYLMAAAASMIEAKGDNEGVALLKAAAKLDVESKGAARGGTEALAKLKSIARACTGLGRILPFFTANPDSEEEGFRRAFLQLGCAHLPREPKDVGAFAYNHHLVAIAREAFEQGPEQCSGDALWEKAIVGIYAGLELKKSYGAHKGLVERNLERSIELLRSAIKEELPPPPHLEAAIAGMMHEDKDRYPDPQSGAILALFQEYQIGTTVRRASRANRVRI